MFYGVEMDMQYETKMKLTPKIEAVLKFAGYTLSIVSIILTVMLLMSLSDSLIDKILMLATGVGFEVSKFAFVPIALLFFHKGLYKIGAFTFIVGGSLVLLSLSASVGFLHSKVDSSAQLAKSNSIEYKMIMSQIDQLDTQIDNLNAAATVDSTSRYRQVRDGASAKTQQAEYLGERKMKLLHSLESINGLDMTASGSLFNSIASMINADPQKVKFYAHLIVGVLLELCAITALFLVGISKASEIKNNDKNVSVNENQTSNNNDFKNVNVSNQQRMVLPNENDHFENVYAFERKQEKSIINQMKDISRANVAKHDRERLQLESTIQSLIEDNSQMSQALRKLDEKTVVSVLDNKPAPKESTVTIKKVTPQEGQGDTATTGDNATRYENVVRYIKSCKPNKISKRNIMETFGCNFEVVSRFFDQMLLDNVIEKTNTNRFRLKLNENVLQQQQQQQ